MKCDGCRRKHATVHLTVLEGKRARESHLCEECAPDDPLWAMLDLKSGIKDPAKLTCPSCRHLNQKDWNFCSACGAMREP